MDSLDIEKLNRTQIILLTLLVSFVTSIATGIVTVSLLAQAPPGVTQTINRVVERTVERIVPTQGAAVITKETTIVVKDDDVIAKSIEKNSKSVVSIWQKVTETTPPSSKLSFVGWGLIMTKEGVVGTDSGIIIDDGTYSIETFDGKTFDTKILAQNEKIGVAFLGVTQSKDVYPFVPGAFGDSDKLRLGQSVISFGGKERSAVSIGIVSLVSPYERKIEGTTTVESFVGSIDSTATPIGKTKGGPLVTIFGDIIGLSSGVGETYFISENLLKQEFEALPKAEEKKSN